MRGARLVDLLLVEDRAIELAVERVATQNTHGTGCTLSSAIAALAPQRPSLAAAVRDAQAYVHAAIVASDSLAVGAGHGPLHHFHALWPSASEL